MHAKKKVKNFHHSKVHSQLVYEARLNDYLVPTLPYKDSSELEDILNEFDKEVHKNPEGMEV